MNRAKILIAILAVLLAGICLIGACQAATLNSEAYAASIYDKLTPELIALYEREIALAPIVSAKPQAYFEKLSGELGISQGKLKTIMLLQDLAAKSGENVSLSALAAKSDFELIFYAKDKGIAYANTLPQERREQLKSMLFSALGK